MNFTIKENVDDLLEDLERLRQKENNSYKDCEDAIKQLQAELKKHRWIPVEDGPPDSIDWKEEVLVLECDSKIPVAMTMEEIFLDEGSDAEYWKRTVLP